MFIADIILLTDRQIIAQTLSLHRYIYHTCFGHKAHIVSQKTYLKNIGFWFVEQVKFTHQHSARSWLNAIVHKEFWFTGYIFLKYPCHAQGCQLELINGPENHLEWGMLYTKKPKLWSENISPGPEFRFLPENWFTSLHATCIVIEYYQLREQNCCGQLLEFCKLSHSLFT